MSAPSSELVPSLLGGSETASLTPAAISPQAATLESRLRPRQAIVVDHRLFLGKSPYRSPPRRALLAANAVRLQPHALSYNLGNFLRTLATREAIQDCSLTRLKEKLIKMGAKAVGHGRYVAFQIAEVAIPTNLFGDTLRLIAELWPPPLLCVVSEAGKSPKGNLR